MKSSQAGSAPRCGNCLCGVSAHEPFSWFTKLSGLNQNVANHSQWYADPRVARRCDRVTAHSGSGARLGLLPQSNIDNYANEVICEKSIPVGNRVFYCWISLPHVACGVAIGCLVFTHRVFDSGLDARIWSLFPGILLN